MRFIALSILLPAVAGAALAAQPLPEPGMHRPMGGRPDFAKMRARHAEDMATLIGLRPDQRPALDAYLTAMEPPHRDWAKGGPDGPGNDAPPPPPPGDAPGEAAGDESFTARLDRMASHLDARDDKAKARIQAARTFYAALDTDQQHRFEALDRLEREDMGPRGPHRGAMGHGGPDGPGGPPPANG